MGDDALKLLLSERHDRQSGITHQTDLLQRGIALDQRKGYGLFKARYRSEIDSRPIAALGGGVGIVFAHHFGHAYDFEASLLW